MSNPRESLRKLKYYRDIKLLLKVFLFSLKVFRSESDSLLSLTNPEHKALKNEGAKKIIKYVNFVLYMRDKLGFKRTCLTKSILLCGTLRQSGINAKVNFGAKKEEGRFRGHCWIGLDEEVLEPGGDYQTIFRYPNNGECG